MLALEPRSQNRLTGKQKGIITLSVIGVGVGIILCLFLFGAIGKPPTSLSGPNLLNNPSFESWLGRDAIGWRADAAKLFKEKSSVVDGDFCIGVMCKNNQIQGSGLSQTIALEPSEIYNVNFQLRSNGILDGLSGYQITYEGEQVNTTTDTEPGIHYHTGGKEWRQYFGRVTGANAMTISFFSQKKAITYVDAVGVGVNLMPGQPVTANAEINR